MKNNFRGKRAELGVYDDATGFTQEERDVYAKMLADNSFDTGLNIFDDKFWDDTLPTSKEAVNNTLTAKALNELIKTVKKSADRQDIVFVGYPGMREKIRQAGFPVDDYKYVEISSKFSPELAEDQVYILPIKNSLYDFNNT